jgi:hypothetical protein
MRPRAARSSALVAAFAALASNPALTTTVFAQTADLRYAASAPLELRYTSADTMSTEMNSAQGAMNSRMHSSMIFAVRLNPAGDSVRVRVETESATGTVEMMGMTQSLDDQLRAPPSEFTIGAKGPGENLLDLDGMDAQNAMSAGLGQAASASVLLLLPGREVSIGESWTDTLTQSGTLSGLDIAATSIVRGTYAGDTTVAGRQYNVLRYTTATEMKASGTTQGMDVEQSMTGERAETVLWDSSRRTLFMRRHTTSMDMTMELGNMPGGMSMKMSGTGTVRQADGG